MKSQGIRSSAIRPVVFVCCVATLCTFVASLVPALGGPGIPQTVWPPGSNPSISDQQRPAIRRLTAFEVPHLWQFQEALAAATMDFDPNEPEIDVYLEANRTPEDAGDLDPTIDVQITQEILDKANELGSPLAMYEFVRNECAFQPYYGSQKGSVETLHQRSGNDYDLASLLIALLRAAGHPARYGEGEVEMTVDQANAWLAVDDPEVAGSILTTRGLEGVVVIDQSEVPVAVRARRIWVETFVPRGLGGSVWVPLDPAFGLNIVAPGRDVPEEMGFDAQTFIEEYYDPADPSVELPRPETPVELFEQEIQDYLDANDPGVTVAGVKRAFEIFSQSLEILPASLPYTVRSRDDVFSEIPVDRRYQLRFELYNGATTFIDHTVDLPTVASKRITISYVGATPSDQATIDSYHGLLFTPPNQVDVSPVLKIDGVTDAASAAGIGAGRIHSSDIHFLAPVNSQGRPSNVVPAIYNEIIAGEYQAIGLAVQGVFSPLLTEENPADTEDFEAQLRNATAKDYLERGLLADHELGALFHARVFGDVADAIVKDQIVVFTDGGGNPIDWEWRGLTVDADRLILGVWKVDEYQSGCGGEGKELLIVSGAEGSLNESLVYEDDFAHEAVSTIKILELASDQEITIHKRWGSLPLPANTQPASVRSALENAINQGHVVTFAADPIIHYNWTGTGYIDMDPCNGAAGYIISGGQNGGSTVDSWTDLIPRDPDCTVRRVEGDVEKPTADSPSADALYWTEDPNKMQFDYKLRLIYEEPECDPGSWGDYSHESRSPSSLAHGYYILTVGDTGPDHQRRLAIVKITIADMARSAGLPLSVSPSKTKNVAVAIDPETGATFEFKVEETGSGNGSGSVSANSTRSTSGPITVLGGAQTTPGNSGMLVIRARLGTRKFGESNGFSVCAHPDSTTHGAHTPVDTATRAGMAIAVTYTSDSGTDSDLSEAFASEQVANFVRTTGCFVGVTPTFNNSGFLRASSPNLVDSHTGPRAWFLNLFDTSGAGTAESDQLHIFYCRRCGMAEADAVAIPSSGYVIRRELLGNPPPVNKVDLITSKNGTAVAVGGYNSSAGPQGGSETVTLRP